MQASVAYELLLTTDRLHPHLLLLLKDFRIVIRVEIAAP